MGMATFSRRTFSTIMSDRIGFWTLTNTCKLIHFHCGEKSATSLNWLIRVNDSAYRAYDANEVLRGKVKWSEIPRLEKSSSSDKLVLSSCRTKGKLQLRTVTESIAWGDDEATNQLKAKQEILKNIFDEYSDDDGNIKGKATDDKIRHKGHKRAKGMACRKRDRTTKITFKSSEAEDTLVWHTPYIER